MELSPLDSIIVPPNRQRREFDPQKINDLADSIRSLGLFHPVVVQNDGVTLVAGERRLRAIKHLTFMNTPFNCHGTGVPPGAVPITKLSDLSESELFEAQLSENVVRTDLGWQEKAEALLQLQKLREMQTGAPFTHKDLSLELHGRADGHFSTREELIVAKNLHNPRVAAAPSVKEAMKILRVEEQQANFARIGATLPTEVLKGRHRLLIGDFREVGLEDGKYAVTITDPPYGINADKMRENAAALSTHTYSDPTGEEWESLMTALAGEAMRISLPDSHHYLFCDFERFIWLRTLWEASGFKVWRRPFIMYRTTSVRAPWYEKGPWASYECILYAIKGERACNMYRTDVITVRGDENLGHGAQKPVAIYTDLLERSAKPGEEVIDLCAGTGTVFAAAHPLKLIATGVEISPQNAAIAAERLKGLT
jgi:predicted RNA methylase